MTKGEWLTDLTRSKACTLLVSSMLFVCIPVSYAVHVSSRSNFAYSYYYFLFIWVFVAHLPDVSSAIVDDFCQLHCCIVCTVCTLYSH